MYGRNIDSQFESQPYCTIWFGFEFKYEPAQYNICSTLQLTTDTSHLTN